MHGLHLGRHVQPLVNEVVEWLNNKNMCQKGFQHALFDSGVIRKEHGREHQLQWDLGVHVQVVSGKIIIFLSLELFRRNLVQVILFVHEHVMQRQDNLGHNHSCDGSQVQWYDWGNFPEESWTKKDEPVIACVAFLQMCGGNPFTFQSAHLFTSRCRGRGLDAFNVCLGSLAHGQMRSLKIMILRAQAVVSFVMARKLTNPSPTLNAFAVTGQLLRR